jgi:hypothetical protein
MAVNDHTVSPFVYGDNNPVNLNDSSGLMVDYSTSFGNPDYEYQMRMRAAAVEQGGQNAYLFSNAWGWDMGAPRGGTSGGDAGATMYSDAADVRWGRMSIEEYAQKWGATTGNPGAISEVLDYLTAPQGWTPQFVNAVFGSTFTDQDGSWGQLTRMPVATTKSPQQYVNDLHEKLNEAKEKNEDYWLVPDSFNPGRALRRVKYQITFNGQTSETLLVDQTINSSRLWGNPGLMDEVTGAPTPILYSVEDFQSNTVTNIKLVIFFQPPLGEN